MTTKHHQRLARLAERASTRYMRRCGHLAWYDSYHAATGLQQTTTLTYRHSSHIAVQSAVNHGLTFNPGPQPWRWTDAWHTGTTGKKIYREEILGWVDEAEVLGNRLRFLLHRDSDLL